MGEARQSIKKRGILSMKKELKSSKWLDAKEMIRKCHLSQLNSEETSISEWKLAFDTLMLALKDERAMEPEFAKEVSELTKDTGFDYDFEDILEEYFDYIEAKEEWALVIESCDQMLENFAWKNALPSEYKFRKGNALESDGQIKAAEAFGKAWLEEYPEDYYAAASNVFLMIAMGKIEEAEELTNNYLRNDLICDSKTDTFFMAAYRLYEITDNIYAKQRVEKKLAEYNAISEAIEE